ncbi:hypothetical protein IKF92_00055 [Candidatus Saccharibacteria bacterium]|nr:hypothetical protein [Candidatus Saccharibacteria bacterium]
MNEDNQKPENLSAKSLVSTVHTITIVLIVCMILAVAGVGLGIYSTIQVNNTISQFSDEEAGSFEAEDEFVDEPEFSKPATVNDIDYVAITYNNGKDYVNIVKDEDEGDYIDYYALDTEGDYHGEDIETDVSPLFNYIFENDLEHCGKESFDLDVAWGIEISSTDGSCYASGNTEQPDWFNAILKKIDADNKGYKSKTIE